MVIGEGLLVLLLLLWYAVVVVVRVVDGDGEGEAAMSMPAPAATACANATCSLVAAACPARLLRLLRRRWKNVAAKARRITATWVADSSRSACSAARVRRRSWHCCWYLQFVTNPVVVLR